MQHLEAIENIPNDVRMIVTKACEIHNCIEICDISDFWYILNATMTPYFFCSMKYGVAEDFLIGAFPIGVPHGRNAVTKYDEKIIEFNRRIKDVDYTKPVMRRLYFFYEGHTYTHTSYASPEIELAMCEADDLNRLEKMRDAADEN